jgi:hypothetical protein
MNISKSRISTFEYCQMQYKYQYLDKIESTESFEMSEGTKFHEWSAQLENKLKQLKDEDTIKMYLESLLENPTRNDWEKYYINFLLELLKKCLDIKKDKWRDYFHPVKIEEKFECKIEEDTYRCICDRIWKSFDDKLMLVELKTGKANLEDCRRELAISKIVIDLTLNVDIAFFGLINPNLKITETEKVKKITTTSTKKAIVKFIEIVKSGIFKKNEFACGNCTYNELCYEYSMFK